MNNIIIKEKSESAKQSDSSKARFTLIKNEDWKPPRKPKERIIMPDKDLPPAAKNNLFFIS
jgi:hypothetical protein